MWLEIKREWAESGRRLGVWWRWDKNTLFTQSTNYWCLRRSHTIRNQLSWVQFLPLTTRGHNLPSSLTHFPNAHCICHSSHSQLFPIITDHLYNLLPPLCLFVSDVYAHVYVWIGLTVFLLLLPATEYVRFCARDTSTVLSRFYILFCFLPVGLFVILKTCLPAIGPTHYSFHVLPHRAVTPKGCKLAELLV